MKVIKSNRGGQKINDEELNDAFFNEIEVMPELLESKTSLFVDILFRVIVGSALLPTIGAILLIFLCLKIIKVIKSNRWVKNE